MAIFNVNIIDSYWNMDEDEIDFREIGTRVRFSGSYEIEMDISEFEEELKIEAFRNKGDGIEIETISTNGVHHVDLILFLWEDDQQEDNLFIIDNILDFLNQFKAISPMTSVEENCKSSEYIIIRDFNVNEDMVEYLAEQGLEIEGVTKVRSTYERGASNYWEALLIALSHSASYDLIKASLAKIKDKFGREHHPIEIDTLNVDRLRKNLADLALISELDLDLVSFTNNHESDTYRVHFRSSYDKFLITASREGTILEFQRRKIRIVN